jgi:hypothetical protein
MPLATRTISSPMFIFCLHIWHCASKLDCIGFVLV